MTERTKKEALSTAGVRTCLAPGLGVSALPRESTQHGHPGGPAGVMGVSSRGAGVGVVQGPGSQAPFLQG